MIKMIKMIYKIYTLLPQIFVHFNENIQNIFVYIKFLQTSSDPSFIIYYFDYFSF